MKNILNILFTVYQTKAAHRLFVEFNFDAALIRLHCQCGVEVEFDFVEFHFDASVDGT